jgi:hypothetical protein
MLSLTKGAFLKNSSTMLHLLCHSRYFYYFVFLECQIIHGHKEAFNQIFAFRQIFEKTKHAKTSFFYEAALPPQLAPAEPKPDFAPLLETLDFDEFELVLVLAFDFDEEFDVDDFEEDFEFVEFDEVAELLIAVLVLAAAPLTPESLSSLYLLSLSFLSCTDIVLGRSLEIYLLLDESKWPEEGDNPWKRKYPAASPAINPAAPETKLRFPSSSRLNVTCCPSSYLAVSVPSPFLVNVYDFPLSSTREVES